jgi:hypothetical protein
MNIDWGKYRQIARAVLRVERSAEGVSAPAPKPEQKRINVCEKIKCPYAYRTSLRASSGCNRYPTAHQCHLVHAWLDLRKETTAYFLHSDADLVNIPGLKKENDSFFLDNPKNRESLELQVELGEGILYAPFGEETFDLAAYLNQ